MTKLGWLKGLAAGAALAVTGTLAQAGEFPERPIDMIVGFKAGGGTDTYARALASAAEAHTGGQPVVVVNKPGGGGLVGGGVSWRISRPRGTPCIWPRQVQWCSRT
ncbi:hypothetical protein [Falsiruegeria mediterranea]